MSDGHHAKDKAAVVRNDLEDAGESDLLERKSSRRSVNNGRKEKPYADKRRPASPCAPCDAREDLSGVPRRRRNGQMASAERLHGQGPPSGCQSRRHLQDVVHEFHHRPQPLLRREYLELVPHERIRHTDKFDDPNLPGEMQTTVSLKKVSVRDRVEHRAGRDPEAIPPEACYLGWQESLTLLAQLIEAEIPG